MKRSILLVAILCVLITSCSREKTFDAAGYVKSTLDAVYHKEYAEYAKIQGISEKEARKIFEQDFEERIRVTTGLSLSIAVPKS